MIRSIVFTLFASFSLTLVACATPTARVPTLDDRAVEAEKIEQRRAMVEYRLTRAWQVGDLMFPLLAANDELCPASRYSMGIDIRTLSKMPKNLRPIMRDRFDMHDDGWTILHIFDGSPAMGRLQVGDKVTAVNGRDPGQDEFDLEGPAMISIERGGVKKSVQIAATPICDYNWSIVEDPQFNAYADGQIVVVHTGVLNMVDNDRQLAFVLAHELAHNAYGHIDAAKQNTMIGGLGGFVVDLGLAAAGVNTGGAFTDNFAKIGSMAHRVAFEAEADYLALYFMARANMDISVGIEDIWRRLSAANPASIDNAYTHPSNPERFLAIKETRKEIRAKQKADQPLIPNMKEKDD